MSDIETFRHETQQWLETNCPAAVRGPDSVLPDVVWGGRRQRFDHDDVKVWLERLAERGWTVPTWPKEYGGAGLTAEQDNVLREEMRAIGTRSPLFSFGMAMLAPVLMEYATEEQKLEHLPKIARGEIRWCQGYSEPGAGSDLAGLQCRMVREGDHYTINGQKIWTSDADVSDWIFALVRTDTEVPKHDGISFVLVDMETEGMSVSPIELISGSSPFCETFFDNVRVPIGNRVGEENKGWTIAKRLLQHERSMLAESTGAGSGASARRQSLIEIARKSLGTPEGQLPDAGLREEIVQFEMDKLCYGATYQRTTDAAKAGRGMGPEGSMFKLYLSEMNQRGSDLRQRLVGNDSLVWDGEDVPAEEREMTRGWLYGKAGTILGGTSEIQMNIIAKRVLGLPD